MTAVFRLRPVVRVLLLVAVSILHFSHRLDAAVDKRYVVRKNDTLIQIAQQHGVTVNALMSHNRLTKPNMIRSGQVLRIPSPKAPTSSSTLDPALRSQLDRVRVTAKKWKYVVVHHSATESGTVAGMDRYHREQGMENGLAYHFVIGNGHGLADGSISIGKRWSEQIDGGHLAIESLNAKSIGVCLVGNFDEDRPTEKQMASLRTLVNYLLVRCRLTSAAVKTHQEIHPKHTRCPGTRFPAAAFVSELSPKAKR